MAREKQTRRMIAMALAAAVAMSVVPATAFAEDGGVSDGGSISAPAGGSDGGSTPDGGSDSTPDGGSDGGDAPKAEGTATDGPINITVQIPATDKDDPATDETDNKNTVSFGDPVGTKEGDLPESEDDDNYNYTEVTQQGSVTVETTEITGSTEYGSDDLDYVTSEVKPTGSNDIYKENASVAPDQYQPGYVPVEGEAPAEDEFVSGDEYLFEYAGTGNTSQFRPAIVFTEPMTDEEKIAAFGAKAYLNVNIAETLAHSKEDLVYAAKDESGNYITDADGNILDANGNKILRSEKTTVGPNGETYYLHRVNVNGSSNNVEGWYEDGEWVKELNSTKYGAVWATAQQFVLIDKATGEVITTYCADVSTPTEDGFGYNMVNLEDSTYYSEKQAEQIRAIAQAGYWGTAEGQGSLEAMKTMLKDAGFTETELESLTDGVALAATQMAIWSCSNHMAGTEFVNSHYFGTPGIKESDGTGVGGNVPTSKEDEVKLMFRIYEYLTKLNPISYEGEETTANTIINVDNFLADGMEITVLEKADGHENNADDNENNDAYVTNVSFALVVTPSTENGDDLVVKVVGADGSVLAEGRVAGTNGEGENYETLEADAEGNYTFKNIVMVEGNQQFNITMEGIQNLKEGVYLYTSEVQVDNETGDTTSSQTMVGTASGEHEVKVSQSLSFSFEVNDEKVVVREKHSGSRDPKPPTPITDIPEEKVPLIDIPEEDVPQTDGGDDIEVIVDEDVPLADLVLGADEEVVAATGDSNNMTAGFGGMLAALAGMFMLRKKKEN